MQRQLTELLALDETVVDGLLDTLAGLLLIAVVASAVKETVTRLNGVVDGLRSAD